MCDVLGFLDQVVAQYYLPGVFLHPTPAAVLLCENEPLLDHSQARDFGHIGLQAITSSKALRVRSIEAALRNEKDIYNNLCDALHLFQRCYPILISICHF
jgi:hypothetical protein